MFRPVTAAEWTELGPAPIINGVYTGRLSAVAASPSNAGRLFVAGASGGVWRTTDGGLSWTPLTDALPTCAMGALALDPANENVVYAGSGEANYANHSLYGLGLYKSVNGGDTWQVLAADTFAGRTFARIVVSHADSSVLYAAVGYAGGFPARSAAKGHPLRDGPVGVFRSVNSGVSWTQLTNGLPSVAATDLVMDPSEATILYAAIGDIFGHPSNGVYKSTDGGNSWTLLGGGLPSGRGRISLAIAPSLPDRLYALVTLPATSTGGGASTDNLYRSDNGGATWTPTNPGSFQATYGWYLSIVLVEPADPDTFYAGGLTMLRGTAGGATYTDITPPHVDMHALAFDANGVLLCGGDGGVHRSLDQGDSWVDLNDGLGVIQFYPGISLHPTNPDFVVGGTQDNGTNRRDGTGLGWTHIFGGDGGYTALHPATPDTFFVESQGTGNLFRTMDGGDSFSYAGSGIVGSDRNCFLPPVTYRANNASTLLYATHRIYRSTNNGTNWSPISGDLTAGPPSAVRALVIAPSNVQTVYAGTNDGRVSVSTDGGSNWSVKLTNVPGWVRVKREIAVDPQNDSVAYLAVAQFGVDQLRRTVDRGETWLALDGDLPDVPVNTVAVHRVGSAGTLFAGTDTGIYTSCDDSQRWRKMGTNLPNVPVMDLVVNAGLNQLVAATLGRGAWSIPLPPDGDSDSNSLLDMFDFLAMQLCFSGSVGQPGFQSPGATCLNEFDLDFDGDVDLADATCLTARLEGP